MERTFSIFNRVLSFAGITIYKKENWNSKLWLFFQIFNVIIGFFTFIFTSGFVLTHLSNLVICIEAASIWTTGVIMFISLCVCLIFKNDFQDFLTEMGFADGVLEMPLINYVISRQTLLGKPDQIWDKRLPRLKELHSLVIDSQETLLRYSRKLFIAYVLSVWLVATLYLCDPIYRMAISEDKDLRLLAFDMWLPWSLQNFKVYVASFIFHAYAGYLCCYAYPGLQLTIIFLVGQTIRQLKIISFIILHLNEIAIELLEKRDERWQECCSDLLKQCIVHFVKIKKFSNQLNVICRPFYLALILVAIMLVCVCSVRIAISANKLSLGILKYYVHEFCFIIVVMTFCLLGQQVQNECEKLESAVVEKWYMFDRRHKIMVRIFNMALSQRIPIYIFGSITLSLPTFTWFIKTGMSFFTLVMSVLEDNNY